MLCINGLFINCRIRQSYFGVNDTFLNIPITDVSSQSISPSIASPYLHPLQYTCLEKDIKIKISKIKTTQNNYTRELDVQRILYYGE